MRRILLLAAALVLAGETARADEYPIALIERPQVLPGGLLQIDGSLDHEQRRALGIETRSDEDLALGAALGIGGRWQLGAATSFGVHPDAAWDRALALGAAFAALDRPRLEIAPTAALPLSFHRGYDLVSTLQLGLGLRARVGERVFVTAGRRLMPIDVRPAVAWNAAIDGGVGVQLAPTVALVAGAEFAELTLVGQVDRTASFLDRLPAEAAVVWTGARIDTSLEVAADLDHPRDDLRVVLRMGVRP